VDLLHALFLGIVQGLTEFLPVSSSGHLVLGQKLLGFETPPIGFDILVHLGTLIAVFVFFRKELVKDFNLVFKKKDLKIFWLVLVGTVPAVLIGLLVKPFLAEIFNSLLLVGVSLILTGLFLFSTSFVKKGKKELVNFSGADALIVGLFQSLAILPGISRSGSTVVAGLWQGLKRKEAFKLSFYLAIPAILGAQVLEIKKLLQIGNGMAVPHLLGFFAATITGFLSLKILKKVVVAGKLSYFGIYCSLVGIIVVITNIQIKI